jgi:hypothetical protein
MYQDHVSIINAGMRADPDIFARGVTFAFLSIRTQFVRVAQQIAEVEAAGTKARALWGHKRGAYDYLRKNKYQLYDEMTYSKDTEKAISYLTTIPGMGIVKSAFVCQLMGHDVGCLDTRNIQRMGLNPREYRTDGESRKQGLAFKRKISRYVDATYGKAELLWNDWCKDVASVYKVSAEEISRDHLVIVPPQLRRTYRDGPAVPIIRKPELPF